MTHPDNEQVKLRKEIAVKRVALHKAGHPNVIPMTDSEVHEAYADLVRPMFHLFIVYPDGRTDIIHRLTMPEILAQIQLRAQGTEFTSLTVTYTEGRP